MLATVGVLVAEVRLSIFVFHASDFHQNMPQNTEKYMFYRAVGETNPMHAHDSSQVERVHSTVESSMRAHVDYVYSILSQSMLLLG